MNIKNIIKNKQNELMQGIIALILCMALFCSAAISVENDGSGWKMRHGGQKYEETGTGGQVQTPLYAGILAEFRTNEIEILVDNHEILTEAAERAAEEAAHPEQGVYTFLQGPKSWEEGRAWSGEWSNQYVRGNYFGNFGCGLCCMANIYCTLTEYTCSPWDMYEYARQVSGYAPSRKIGAIGWADMKVTLRKSGFDCTLNTKPESYEQFQQEITASQMAVVLVSSRDDDTYWKKTGGHYVSISLYDASSDQVFLGDPADPDGNRSWIPLRYVYDALKTVSQYQYLLVQDYTEEQNQWMHDGITDAWGGM